MKKLNLKKKNSVNKGLVLTGMESSDESSVWISNEFHPL